MSKHTAAQKRVCNRLAKRVGTTLEWRQHAWGPMYNGDRAYVTSPTEDGLHEIAHFQLAAPSRRYLPNYGLGNDSEGGQAARVVSPGHAAREEVLASYMNCLWALKLFGPKESLDLYGYLRMHASFSQFMQDMAELQRLGLIDENCQPLPVLRAPGTRLRGAEPGEQELPF